MRSNCSQLIYAGNRSGRKTSASWGRGGRRPVPGRPASGAADRSGARPQEVVNPGHRLGWQAIMHVVRLARATRGRLWSSRPVWHRHFDVMLGQIIQHAADRPGPLEELEHQPIHALHLFIRIQDHLARRAPDIAHRQRLGEFTAPRLCTPTLQHPRLDDMQFGFRHRALEPSSRRSLKLDGS